MKIEVNKIWYLLLLSIVAGSTGAAIHRLVGTHKLEPIAPKQIITPISESKQINKPKQTVSTSHPTIETCRIILRNSAHGYGEAAIQDVIANLKCIDPNSLSAEDADFYYDYIN